MQPSVGSIENAVLSDLDWVGISFIAEVVTSGTGRRATRGGAVATGGNGAPLPIDGENGMGWRMTGAS
jgi:hypothetical protein